MVKWQIFWRAVLLRSRKFSAHQEMCPPALPKIFSAHQEMRPPIFSACFSRLRFRRHRLKTGRGTRDEGREKWEGEAPAEPKRRRIANSEWRMVNGEWRVASSFSGGQCFRTAEKNFWALKNCTSHLALKFGSLGGSPSQRRMNSALRKNPSNPMSLVPCPLSLTG
jgi:hypothetical protein